MCGAMSFFSTDNLPIPGITPEDFQEIFRITLSDYGISVLQAAENGGFSLAMVVRYALGLSAEGGHSAIIYNDSLAGAVTLAGARHLVNAGASVKLFHIIDPGCINAQVQAEINNLLTPLKKMGAEPTDILSHLPPHALHEELPRCHNVILGMGTTDSIKMSYFVDALNDSPAPIHCVQCPLGLNPILGKPTTNTIFASSTLSLGAPLVGLSEGAEYVGRHYVCDISIPHVVYSERGINYPFLFSDQPVKQILPPQAPEEEEIDNGS